MNWAAMVAACGALACCKRKSRAVDVSETKATSAGDDQQVEGRVVESLPDH